MSDYQEYLDSEGWKAKRDMVRQYWDNRCALCNAEGELHVHHRTYERRGNERLTDLILLCKDCHSKFHDKGAVSIDIRGVINAIISSVNIHGIRFTKTENFISLLDMNDPNALTLEQTKAAYDLWYSREFIAIPVNPRLAIKPPSAPNPPPTSLDQHDAELMAAFTFKTGIPAPDENKKDGRGRSTLQVYWQAPARKMTENLVTIDILIQAIEKLREKNQPVISPNSVANTAINIKKAKA